jgi:hypothetical protein
MANTTITDTRIRVDEITNSTNSGAPSFPLGLSVTGPLNFSNGSAASPSITFTSDLDTGLFRKGSNSVGFSAGGIEVGSFDSTGTWNFGSSASTLTNHEFVASAPGAVLKITGYGTGGAYLRIVEDGVQEWFQGMDNGSSILKIRPTSLATGAVAECTTVGTWSFGPSSKFSGVTAGNPLINGFFFTGPIRIDASSIAQIRSSSSGGTLEFVNEGSGVGAGFSFWTQNRTVDIGSVTGNGTWTLGPSTGSSQVNVVRGADSYVWQVTRVPASGAHNGVLVVSSNTPASPIFGMLTCFPASGAADGYRFAAFLTNSGDIRGSITLTGGGTQVAYNTTSDSRLKQDLGDWSGLEVVEQLEPRKFKWIESEFVQHGLFAQEAETVVPYAVTAPDSVEGRYSMDYSKLTPILIKSIQELKEKLDQAEARIAILEGI